MRQVTLVIGPPCAGKTTHVATHAHPGDLVVDWDQLAIEAGSLREHDHEPQYRTAANAARKQLEQRIADTPDICAWIIRTIPDPSDRPGIMTRLGVTELQIIDPGPETCLARARADDRPADIDAVILKWYGHAWGARCYDKPGSSKTIAKLGPDPRHTGQWRTIRKLILRGQPPCAICGQPMLYGVKFNRANPHPLYPTVDHITQLADGGAMYDPANLRPCHWRCNSERASTTGGRKATAAATHRTSEDW